jgi:hypothetical protein
MGFNVRRLARADPATALARTALGEGLAECELDPDSDPRRELDSSADAVTRETGGDEITRRQDPGAQRHFAVPDLRLLSQALWPSPPHAIAS